MADYKELLRKAVQALPENNGASRRAVYEKARSALVGQLRAINPPLPARDITAHRLQLEDCIRQVEQEASEAVIAGMQDPPGYRPDPPPTQPPKLETRPQGKSQPAPVEPPAPEPNSIEQIIAAAEAALPTPKPAPKAPARPAAAARASGARSTRAKAAAALAPDPEPEPRPIEAKAEPVHRIEPKPEPKTGPRPNGKAARPLPSIVARAEAAKTKTIPPTVFGVPPDKPYDGGRRAPTIEPRRETTVPPRLDPGLRVAAARTQPNAPASGAVGTAMSAVREVEVEPAVATDPQGAIDRAIATLDREARGDTSAPGEERSDGHGQAQGRPNGKVIEMPLPKAEPSPPERKQPAGSVFDRDRQERSSRPDRVAVFERPERGRGRRDSARRDRDVPFQRAHGAEERGGVSALTIFLGVVAVLLVAVGGAGVWAWQEGYLNLDAMFARGEPGQQEAVVPQANLSAAAEPTALQAATTVATATEAAPEERLTPEPTVESAAVEPLALVPQTSETPPAAEERLPGSDQAIQPAPSEAAVASLDPATQAGSQSLLLEATDEGTNTAVPFSGTVEWSKGVDETGAPTLIGKATIPARNLGVDLLIRKNSDPTLPASHLMEINFSVSDTFIGGSIAYLPGVLLKDVELTNGTPLAGASARVVSNQFLVALSATAEDRVSNYDLLTKRRWIDLAVIYATGKRALITLEKDDAADQLFRDVFTAWGVPEAAASVQQ